MTDEEMYNETIRLHEEIGELIEQHSPHWERISQLAESLSGFARELLIRDQPSS
jgi:hypothetical protein